MPLELFVTCREQLRIEHSAGFSAISSDPAKLTEDGWQATVESLEQNEVQTGALVLQEEGFRSRLVSEAFATMPSRLASLAIHPGAVTCLVARSRDVTRELVNLVSDGGPAVFWRFLREFSKRNARIESRIGSSDQPLVEYVGGPLPSDDAWLPELLAVPPSGDRYWIFQELKLNRPSDLCGKNVSLPDAPAVYAGLWLLHGDATESHRYSQSIEDEGRHRSGNFWHAIMHRQEPDYGNSKYWFRRVGQHPIFPELARRADELIQADGSDATLRWQNKLGTPHRWDPFVFVDWCESAVSESDAAQIRLLRRIQFLEMHLLLRASYRDAIGDS